MQGEGKGGPPQFSNNNIFYIEFVDCVDEVLSAKYKNVVLGTQNEAVLWPLSCVVTMCRM